MSSCVKTNKDMLKNKDIIYKPGLRKLCRNFIFYRLIIPMGDFFMKTYIARYYFLIKKMQAWSKEEIINWQNIQISKLAYHAYNNTIYYKNLFDKHHIKPENINSISDLEKIPVLTKQMIKENIQDIKPHNLTSIPHKIAYTGGSTGMPLTYLLDNHSWSFSTANTVLNRERFGWYFGDKHIVLGSSSLYVSSKHSFKHKIYYMLKRKIGLNGMNMSEEVCHNYIEIIREENIKYIYGYASSIYVLASYILSKNISLKLNGCFSTSEKLTHNYKIKIQQAFQCNVLDEYGANDGGITAFDHGNGIFRVGYNSVFTKPTSKNCFSAKLTDLTNFAFPLINYELGDQFCVDSNSDAFNYNGQVFSQLQGRSSDIITLENGNVITGPGFTVLFSNIPVDYYCIEKNGKNTINCYIKKLPEYNLENEIIIRSSILKHIGHNAKLNIIYSDTIYYSKNGKRIYFKTNHTENL